MSNDQSSSRVEQQCWEDRPHSSAKDQKGDGSMNRVVTGLLTGTMLVHGSIVSADEDSAEPRCLNID